MGDYYAFTAGIVQSGEPISGEPLQKVETASPVAIHSGESIVTDGPLTHTKETLGGFCMIDGDSLERAQAIAAEIPTAKFGRIEVRSLMKMSGPTT